MSARADVLAAAERHGWEASRPEWAWVADALALTRGPMRVTVRFSAAKSILGASARLLVPPTDARVATPADRLRADARPEPGGYRLLVWHVGSHSGGKRERVLAILTEGGEA